MLAELVTFAILNLAFATGIALALRGWLRGWAYLDRLFAGLVVGFSVLIAGSELLSLVGRLRFGALAFFAGTVLLAGLVLAIRAHIALGTTTAHPAADAGANEPGHALRPSAAPWTGAEGTMLFLGLWGALYYLLRGVVLPVEPVSDAPIYHLPLALRWWQAGRIEWLSTPFGELAAPYFPANGDLWFTWLQITAPGGTLLKVGQWPFLLLGALAIFRLAQLAGARTAGIFPATVWLLSPPALVFAPVAIVDLFLATWYLIAMVFLVQFCQPQKSAASRTKLLILLGLAAGLALGSKSIGLVLVPWLVVPVVVRIVREGQPMSRLCLLAVAGAVPSAYWFLRNWFYTGNPVYPLHVEVFGVPLFYGWYERAVMLQSGYHQPAADWRSLVLQLASVLDLRMAWLWPAAAAYGLVRRRVSPSSVCGGRPLATLVAFGLLHLALFWWVIPYNTQHRFLLAGLGLLLVPLAPAVAGRWWLQWPLVALCAWHLLGPQWLAPAPARPAILVPLARDVLSMGSVGHWLALPGSLAAAFLIAGRWWFHLRHSERPPALRWRTWLRCAAALLLLAAGASMAARPGARALAQDRLLTFYPIGGFASELLPTWTALDRLTTGQSCNIAYAGTNLPYYLYGVGLRQRPMYVNVSGPADWHLHDFHQARRQAGLVGLAETPFPQWYREQPSYDIWFRNLRERRIGWLFVARENLHGRKEQPTGPAPFPIEYAWAMQHPEVFEPKGPFLAPGQTEPFAWVFQVRQGNPAGPSTLAPDP